MSNANKREESYGGDSNSPFYFNTSHWRAVDGMLAGVKERAGIMVLTGPPGSGKTMIMRAISEGLEENTPGLFLQYASLNFREFVNFLHSSLKVEDEIMDAPNKAVALRQFLYVQAKRDETGVVFIDEAHNLEPDVLKMLPKLARFDTLEDGRIVGLQFVLIGSEELTETLAEAEFSEVSGKVMQKHELRFFTRGELTEFLKKRLAPIARLTDEPITDDGVDAMGRFSGGSPRLIGMICSHAMLFAAENPGKSIDAKMVEEAADALMLKEAENPFAHEADIPDTAAGPFSEADLSGETQAASEEKAPDLPFTDTQTIYTDDASADDAADVKVEKTPVADDSLYAADHVAVAPPPVAQEDEVPGDEMFDPAALNHSLDDDLDDDFGDIDDLDDMDFDDDDDMDDLGEGLATLPKQKRAIKKGGTSFLSRLGFKGAKGESGDKDEGKVLGANRKRDRAEPLPTKEKRKTKTVVAGQREKQMKMAGMVAGVALLVGGGAMAVKPVMGMLSGIGGGEKMVAAPAMPDLGLGNGNGNGSGMAAQAPSQGFGSTTGQAQSAGLDQNQDDSSYTVSVENPPATPKTGGWGARVVVEKDPINMIDTPQVAGAEAPSAAPSSIPEPAANLARGALDLVDRALGTAEENTGGVMRNVFAAASGEIAGMRTNIANRGLSAEEVSEKISKLIAEADSFKAQKQLIAPSGKNAYDSYRAVLELNPDHETAMTGIRELRELYASKAQAAREARQWETANGYFETAIAISNLRPVR